MMTSPPVRAAAPSEVLAVSYLIATAFEPLPQSAYLVPDLASRRRVLAAQFAIMIEHAFTFGCVDVVDVVDAVDAVDAVEDTGVGRDGAGRGLAAAAVWFDYTVSVPSPPAYDTRLKQVTGQWHANFVRMDAVLDQHHPTDPHHFLLFLAVHPSRQGQGLGSGLLQHHHGGALGEHAAYLDAASLASRDLYSRHGYQPLPTYEITPGVGFWPMRRP